MATKKTDDTNPDKPALQPEAPEAGVTETTTVTTKKKAAPVWLAADAEAAKAMYGAEDKRIADSHQQLRDDDKVVMQTPLVGYDAARENIYVKPEDKTTPEPENVDEVAPPK